MKMKANKNKQKSLPKLKAILANPYKMKCPALEENELNELRAILESAIADSGMEPTKFATAKHLHLGLQSTLRAVNNRKCSCLLISLSIKPTNIISLLASNAEVKDATLPVYVQPKLEDFVQLVFGIKSLALSLPLDTKIISDNLHKWVDVRKQSKIKRMQEAKQLEAAALRQAKTLKKIKQKTSRTCTAATTAINSNSVAVETLHPATSAPLTTYPEANDNTKDFISLTDHIKNSQQQTFADDKVELDALLNNMTKDSQKNEFATELKSESMNVDFQMVQNTGLPPATAEPKYQTLIVHKIFPNPDKLAKRNHRSKARKRKAN